MPLVRITVARGLGAERHLVEVAKENWSFGGGLMSYPPQ